MKWYFAITEPSFERTQYDWPGMIRAAVKSAKQNTSLLPHMIYDGQPNALTRELESMGVKIIPHRISFYDALTADLSAKGPEYVANFSGAYLRNEIPLIEREDDVVLYTDCDVIFLKNPQLPPTRPSYFAAAPEETQDNYEDINTGVMLMNVVALRRELPAFIEFIKAGIAAGRPEDQPMYNLFYRGRWDRLDITLNWKPYWGINPAVQIVHWHGPKPVWVRDSLEKSGTKPPEPAHWWRLVEGKIPVYREFLAMWSKYGEFPREQVFCQLDDFVDGYLWGWAVDKSNPARTVHMDAFIDGEKIAAIVCSGIRPDVKRAGHGSEVVGYKFRIPDSLHDGALHRLEFRSTATGLPISFNHSGKWLRQYEFCRGGQWRVVFPLAKLSNTSVVSAAPGDLPVGRPAIQESPLLKDDLIARDLCYSEQFLTLLAELNEHIASIGDPIEGGICYLNGSTPEQYLHSPPIDDEDHLRKRINLATVARESRQFLEVGLNAGHSALIALHANPSLHLLAVDVCYHRYTAHAAEFLKAKFGERFTFFSGDSREVLPALSIDQPDLRFDGLHVDGGHSTTLLAADLSNCIRLSSDGAIFIIDDVNAEQLRAVFETYVALGYFATPAGLLLLPTELHAIVRLVRAESGRRRRRPREVGVVATRC